MREYASKRTGGVRVVRHLKSKEFMGMIDSASLIRGAAFFDFARSDRGENLKLSVPDLIGMVAAYADHCSFPITMEDGLSEVLPPLIIERLMQTLQLFNDPDGKGLWCQGDDIGNFRFTPV